jgi:hypothetical protein
MTALSLATCDPNTLITLAHDLGQRYSVYKPSPDLRSATCPRCKGRVTALDMRRVSTFSVRFPRTESCQACDGTGDDGDCLACDGRGYVVVGTVTRHADMVCELCCVEMRGGRARAGYAPCYTRGRA